MQDSLEQVGFMKDRALEVGTEMGKLENLIASTEWLRILDALVKGEDSATPSQIRVIGLTVTKAVSAWFESNYKDDPHASVLRLSMSKAASQLENWIP